MKEQSRYLSRVSGRNLSTHVDNVVPILHVVNATYGMPVEDGKEIAANLQIPTQSILNENMPNVNINQPDQVSSEKLSSINDNNSSSSAPPLVTQVSSEIIQKPSELKQILNQDNTAQSSVQQQNNPPQNPGYVNPILNLNMVNNQLIALELHLYHMFHDKMLLLE